MTIREIINRQEKVIFLFISENLRLKKEINEIRTEKRVVEKELNSLKKILLKMDKETYVAPESKVVDNGDSDIPETKIVPDKPKKTRKRKKVTE